MDWKKGKAYKIFLKKRNYDKLIISQLHNGGEEFSSDFEPRKEKETSRKFPSFVGNLNLAHPVEYVWLELEAEISIEEAQNALNGF